MIRLLGCVGLALLMSVPARAAAPQAGSVIFIHPDGSSLAAWNAARIASVGPDGLLEWDQLPRAALYRSHFKDGLSPSSHAGGTVHAWGVKVISDSYGLDGKTPIKARSGADESIMLEARDAGLAIGIVQTGQLAEPGTGVFLASSERRADYTGIARKIIESRADVILAAGEVYLLPKGVKGRHGAAGVREDAANLITYARDQGYTIVYTREELRAAAAQPETRKLLGVFAAEDTYNAESEETLAARGLPAYQADAPTVAEMTEAALAVFERLGKRFMLVVEEEGTDNFANINNASGVFEAFRRADAAIGVARRFLDAHPDTLLLTAADSDASGLQLIGLGEQKAEEPAPVVPKTTKLGNPIDGIHGTGTEAFLSGPDRAGRRFWFGVTWSSGSDMVGGIVARAAGLNAGRLPVSVDNTELYDLMWETLFGRELPPPRP